jgi:hypothetical protein
MCFFFLLKKSETKNEESSSTPSDETIIESTSSSPSEPILEPRSNIPPINIPITDIRPTINISIPHQNESDNNLLSMFIFLCCMILSFLLLRRIFLTFGANRSYPPPSSDPFHDDF